MAESTIILENGMAFDCELQGHHFYIDANEQFGGQNKGPSPKGLLLTSLAGCTAMDVISLLRKMRQEVECFKINVSADTTTEHPKVYSKIHIKYILKGKLEQKKVEKAINLSQERYCGVSAMLSKACPITYEIIIEE